MTTLYSESFVPGVLTLGHSLTSVNTNARKVLLYFPSHISPSSQCLLRAAGWELYPIARVQPPDNGRGVYPRFLDQYSKLQIWSLDSAASLGGLRAVLYLDADTLVRRNVDELWAIAGGTAFAAVPDVYGDKRGFARSFNAGVLLLRTSSAVYADMLAKIGSARYKHEDAEQGFLNVYYAAGGMRLPYVYNANLALKKKSREMWEAIGRDVGIVHYTSRKPFPYHINNEDGGIDDARIQENLKEMMNVDEGMWAEEMGWWADEWAKTKEALEGKCS